MLAKKSLFWFPLLLGLLYPWYNKTVFHGRNGIAKRKRTNILCPPREFYDVKSYIYLYIHIYICPTQKNYNIYATKSSVYKKGSLACNISWRENWNYSDFSMNLVRRYVFFSCTVVILGTSFFFGLRRSNPPLTSLTGDLRDFIPTKGR